MPERPCTFPPHHLHMQAYSPADFRLLHVLRACRSQGLRSLLLQDKVCFHHSLGCRLACGARKAVAAHPFSCRLCLCRSTSNASRALGRPSGWALLPTACTFSLGLLLQQAAHGLVLQAQRLVLLRICHPLRRLTLLRLILLPQALLLLQARFPLQCTR